jgi:hypothetical protein
MPAVVGVLFTPDIYHGGMSGVIDQPPQSDNTVMDHFGRKITETD